MKKSLTLLLLLLSFINSSRASEVIVTYPNTQDVIFNVNSIYPILWDSDNTLPVNSEVEILLSINDGKDYFIKLGTSLNDGIEIIKIPSNFSKSSKCRIKVQSIDNQLFNDESDFSFSISSEKWSFLLDNADTVRVPQNDALTTLELYSYHMRPYKKWHYTLKNTPSYVDLLYYHQQITIPLGCAAQQLIFQYAVAPFAFVISKSGTYRFTHTKENANSNFNTINILKYNLNGCDALVSSSYTIFYNNGVQTWRRSTSVNTSLIRGSLYQVKVFNDNIFTDFSGFLEIFESTVRNAQYYEVQIPQPITTAAYIVLDNSMKIVKFSDAGNFDSLPVGTYRVLGLSYPQTYDLSILLNQKITDIDFNAQNLLITENIKILEITPKCPQNLSLTNIFHGTLKEAVLDNITSNQQIINTSNINYQAGKSIILESGFFINRPNLFKAEIKTCQ